MLLSWVAACSAPPASPTTIDGLQVVAIATNPPNPTGAQYLDLEVWVADGLGLGADVLVWMCTPVDGRCAEFHALPDAEGLPLVFVTKTGPAAPVFRTTTSWPILGSIALDYLSSTGSDVFDGELGGGQVGLLVWALACVPGLCDVFRQVEADPVVGSPTWWDATASLADPSRILEAVRPGEASVAVKFVPLWQWVPGEIPFEYPQTPDVRPQLGLVSQPSNPDGPVQLGWFDPDGDPVHFQAFTTRGAVSVDYVEGSSGSVVVDPRPDLAGQFGDLFVVGEDGRGGTAVWATTAEQRARCEPEVLLPGGPDPGDVVALGYGWQVGVRFRGLEHPNMVQGRVANPNGRTLLDGGLRFADSETWEYGGSGAAAAAFDPCTWQDATLFLNLSAPTDLCALSGTPLTAEVTVRARGGAKVRVEVPVIAGVQSYFYCP